MEALLLGSTDCLLWPIPSLLSRAGFSVDMVTTSRLLRSSRFVRRVATVSSRDEIIETARRLIAGRDRAYDWVIAGDDDTLRAMERLDWPAHLQPRIFPIPEGERAAHVYSKIGLSRILSAAGIQTPAFAAVRTCAEAVNAAGQLGYPVFLKLDASGGGLGVRFCRCDGDVMQLSHMFDGRELLVQKSIRGGEIDLSAIFFESELVHFNYSRVQRTLPGFGPSIVREYYPLAGVSNVVFDEVAALGRAIGGNGFVNVSCIEAADRSGRWYIEADLRANAWSEYPMFFGEDPSIRIRDWFESHTVLAKENCRTAARGPVRIPYFMRLHLWELLVNRYNVWRFIPFADRNVVVRLLVARCIGGVGKELVPDRVKAAAKQRLRDAGILFS